MSKLLIIEGPDCSGKSTLARNLCSERKAVYLHASGAKSLHLAMQDYHLSLLAIARANLNLGHDVVMDRFWPSEYVYGQIFRPEVSNRNYDFDVIVEQTQALNPIYIFCGDQEVAQRHKEQQDPDHPYNEKQFEMVISGYNTLKEEMVSTPALPLFHPKRAGWQFTTRSYVLGMTTANLHI